MTNTESRLRKEIQENGKLVITAELNPPKGTDLSKLLDNARRIKDLVTAINITDMSGASMKMCSMAVSHLIERELGIETIWQMTCRDRNRLALQSDLLGGAALGLKNILPLRGDDPKGGDHSDTEQCFDLGTEDLLKAVANLKTGTDLAGNDVKIEEAGFDYCVGSAAHPGLPDLNGQKETMERRAGMGVEFFQTQICFEKEQIAKFVDAIGEDLASKTLLGLTPLKSLGQAEFMNKNIFGVTVPEDCINKMKSALGDLDPKSDEAKTKQQEAGLEIARDLVDYIRTSPLKGIHVMAIGQEKILDHVISSITNVKVK